jgi:hypothetical protein
MAFELNKEQYGRHHETFLESGQEGSNLGYKKTKIHLKFRLNGWLILDADIKT